MMRSGTGGDFKPKLVEGVDRMDSALVDSEFEGDDSNMVAGELHEEKCELT